ncbi:MAG: hypothetical protein GEU80_11890 [Dehalococcoidia bacterium]|nr:hypothetical protein [Dehalococcoidia bacterium]
MRSGDLARLLGTGAGYALSWLVPRRLDGAASRLQAAVVMRAKPGQRRHLERAIEHYLGLAPAQAASVVREHYWMRGEKNWLRVRGLRDRRAIPRVEVEGIEHLHRAIEAGRGVILWRMGFGSTLWAQAACWQAGHPLVQLSHQSHGATSYSRLGVGSVAGLYVRPELPYLAERVIIPRRKSLAYLQTLIQRLAQDNAIVAFRAELTSRQSSRTTLFGEPFELANGAPSLAWKTGATLLTAAALRDGPMRYRLVIDAPVEVDRSMPRKEAMACAVDEFARRLEARAREHPADWMGWYRRGLP